MSHCHEVAKGELPMVWCVAVTGMMEQGRTRRSGWRACLGSVRRVTVQARRSIGHPRATTGVEELSRAQGLQVLPIEKHFGVDDAMCATDVQALWASMGLASHLVGVTLDRDRKCHELEEEQSRMDNLGRRPAAPRAIIHHLPRPYSPLRVANGTPPPHCCGML